jgi:7-carboxy-7-deazaguanine synthase
LLLRKILSYDVGDENPETSDDLALGREGGVMSSFAVKEIFLTLQGEGAQCGRPAVFCRFSGCNLWSGREEDRASAVCKFCDTDFVGVDGTSGGRYRSADELATAIEREWLGGEGDRFCVLTGGEPLLQVDDELIAALHSRGFEIAVETNGTIAAPEGIDWVCVSPKSSSELAIRSGHELKLVFPQADATPDRFEHLAFDRFLLQPMDGEDVKSNTERAIDYCLRHPRWRLSVQTHKQIGIR